MHRVSVRNVPIGGHTWATAPGKGGVSELNPLAEVRQERITALVEEQGFVRVSDLSARFGVSTVTVRTDLQSLESRARVRRIRGGAMPPSGCCAEQPFESSQRDASSEKSSIGGTPPALVADGDTVMLDVGTTTTAIARALVRRPTCATSPWSPTA